MKQLPLLVPRRLAMLSEVSDKIDYLVRDKVRFAISNRADFQLRSIKILLFGEFT